ncbi:heterokaryon incompatibility protein-domain-containing protein [Podospora conica]|nr:heterokaryon incompatibility protein-domain-containing protein [Schizothecium conicum]
MQEVFKTKAHPSLPRSSFNPSSSTTTNMRLLEVHCQKLEYFVGDDLPPYAILSHTWGEDEVLFEHIRDAPPTLKEIDGWKKVDYACTQAQQDDYDYVWIDTCCIDKSSSAELSEAINSMFKWYLRAATCYAYLSDVNDTIPEARFEQSRWFTRGWTLQELIAPSNVVFFDSTWKRITSRQELSVEKLIDVTLVTNIPSSVLRRKEERLRPCLDKSTMKEFYYHDYDAELCRRCLRRQDSLPVLDTFISAERMSWAAGRKTTRAEDRAYSLLGLFGINMPLLYGEGSRAFLRLQEEILKQSHDQSLFAFARPLGDNREGPLAESPDLFAHSEVTGRVIPSGEGRGQSYTPPMIFAVTPKTIELEMYLHPCQAAYPGDPRSEYQIAVLECFFKDDLMSQPAILLKPSFQRGRAVNRREFTRADCGKLIKISPMHVGDRVLDWNSFFGWSSTTETAHRFSRAGKLCTIGLHLASNTSAPTSHGNARDLLSTDKPASTSTATLLKIPRSGYRYLGCAPGPGTAEKEESLHIGGDHPGHAVFYLPPVNFFRSSLISLVFPQDVLGIICIRNTAMEEPFFILWGHLGASSGLHGSLWCKVVSVSDIVSRSYAGTSPWRREWVESADPRKDLPGSLLRAFFLGDLIHGRQRFAETDVIIHRETPHLADRVSVKRLEWRGMPLYEIVVTPV